MAKRYYWLKLKEDFFDKKLIKKLRSIAGGDTYTIIYLKMQLKSIKNEGILKYEGIENSFEEELALDIDEDLENVKVTLAFLQKHNMILQSSEEDFILKETLECIGSETDSAERKRNQRKREKMQLKERDIVTNVSLPSHVEKDIEKDIDIEDRLDNKIIYSIKEKIEKEKRCLISEEKIKEAIKKAIEYDPYDIESYAIEILRKEVDKYGK